MNKISMMRKLVQPARMAAGGYSLPRISPDSVAAVYGQVASSNPNDIEPDTSNFTPPSVTGPQFNLAPPAATKTRGPNWGAISGRVAQVGEALAPFASNIANAFQKPPMPAQPTYDNSVTLTAPRYDNERNTVSREINGTNASLYRNLDANTAARLTQNNLGVKLNQLSSINERENNARAETSNRQALVNSGIQSRNNDKTDAYNRDLVERSIAQERTQSENIANAGDKYVGIQNEKRKAKVDLEKTKTMAELFRNSGVGTRLRQQLMEDGVTDPTGQDYADLKKKRNGGVLNVQGASTARQFNRQLRPRPNTSYRQLLTAKPQ